MIKAIISFLWNRLQPLILDIITERHTDYSESIKEAILKVDTLKQTSRDVLDYALSMRDTEIRILKDTIHLLETRINNLPGVEVLQGQLDEHITSTRVSIEGVGVKTDDINTALALLSIKLNSETQKFQAISDRIEALSQFDNGTVAECVELLPQLKKNISLYKSHHKEIIEFIMDIIQEAMRVIPTTGRVSLEHKINVLKGKLNG
jgi:hypothetical protein